MAWIKGFAWILGFFLVASFMGWIWWDYPELITKLFPELAVETLEKRGVFGDMFGSLNALFSGIALVGVIFAVFMQRKELQLQREDLQRSIKAQEESSQALSEQLKEMQEQTEFQKLPFLVVKISSCSTTGGGSTYSVFNIGNSTAINVLIYDITVKYFIRPTHSVIAQSGEIDLELAMNKGEQKELIISFENINGKPYYIEESVKDDTYKIEKFEPGKYEFPISID